MCSASYVREKQSFIFVTFSKYSSFYRKNRKDNAAAFLARLLLIIPLRR